MQSKKQIHWFWSQKAFIPHWSCWGKSSDAGERFFYWWWRACVGKWSHTVSQSLEPLSCRSSAEPLSSASTYDLNFLVLNAVYVTPYKLRTLSKGLLEYCTDDTYEEMLKLCIRTEKYWNWFTKLVSGSSLAILCSCVVQLTCFVMWNESKFCS